MVKVGSRIICLIYGILGIIPSSQMKASNESGLRKFFNILGVYYKGEGIACDNFGPTSSRCVEGHHFSGFTVGKFCCNDMQFIGCVFENVVMKDVYFSGILFRGCFFKNCVFDNCTFFWSTFKGIAIRDQFSKQCIVGSRFENCHFSKTLHQEELYVKTLFKECNFEYASMERCQYLGSYFKKCRTYFTNFARSHFLSSLFEGSNFESHVTLNFSRYDRCSISHAILQKACSEEVNVFNIQSNFYLLKCFNKEKAPIESKVFKPQRFYEEDEECSLCFEQFECNGNHNRAWLLCGHSLCRSCCIALLINSRRGVPSCPFCTKDFVVLNDSGIISKLTQEIKPKKIFKKATHRWHVAEWDSHN